MIGLPMDARAWLVASAPDMHCGFHCLVAKVVAAMEETPYGGLIHFFRGRRDDAPKEIVSPAVRYFHSLGADAV